MITRASAMARGKDNSAGLHVTDDLDLQFDVFVSYSRNDRDIIEPIVKLLVGNGLSLWWDQEMPVGVQFQEFIPRVIEGSKACIAFWTNHSIESPWVRSEANRAASQKKLLCVEVDGAEAPPPFDAYNNLRVKAEELRADPIMSLRKLRTGLQLIMGFDPMTPAPKSKSKAKAPGTQSDRYKDVAPLPSGTTVKDYTVIRTLGRGGFWIAYQAWDGRNAQQVVLREGAQRGVADRRNPSSDNNILGLTSAALKFYESRARTASIIHRAAEGTPVGGALDFFAANGTWYVVSPFARGSSLDKLILQGGTRTDRSVSTYQLLQRTGELISQLHSLEYVHGDIKPGNVVVVGDIGRDAQGSATHWSVALIDFDTFTPIGEKLNVLSPIYSAPETPGGIASETAEIYSLGMTLFHWWTGIHLTKRDWTLPMDAWKTSGVQHLEDLTPQVAYSKMRMLAKDARSRRLALSIAASLCPDPLLRPHRLGEWIRYVGKGDRKVHKRMNDALAEGGAARGKREAPGAEGPASVAASAYRDDATRVVMAFDRGASVLITSPDPTVSRVDSA